MGQRRYSRYNFSFLAVVGLGAIRAVREPPPRLGLVRVPADDPLRRMLPLCHPYPFP